MTIGETIATQRRPYIRAGFAFGALAAVAFVIAGATLWRMWATKQLDLLDSWFGSVLAIGFWVGYLGWFTTQIIPVLTIRCPECKGKIGPLRKNWRHCPCCGIAFESERQS